jgi:hypothetical protein
MLVTPTIAAQVEAVVGMGDHGLLPSTVKPNPIQHCACAYAQTRAKTAQRRVTFILWYLLNGSSESDFEIQVFIVCHGF